MKTFVHMCTCYQTSMPFLLHCWSSWDKDHFQEAYKPSMNKLSSQYLIQDQMTSHYYNLAAIKSAIDNRPPESTRKSIKKQDQMKRKAFLQQNVQTNSKKMDNTQKRHSAEANSTTANHDSFHYLEQSRSAKEGDCKYRKDRSHLSSSYSETNLRSSKLRSSEVRSYSSFGKGSPRSFQGTSSYRDYRYTNLSFKGGNTTKPSPKNVMEVTYSGDYLNKHENRFHNSEMLPFTPRTKKRKGKSFLASSEFYAPPARNMQKKKNEKKTLDQDHVTVDNVKTLNDTDRDEDHRRWLEEQSQYMQHLSLLEDQKDYTNIPESARSDTRKRIEDEEEELRYLTFINEVTNDILSRGTYSDSVINQIMERHIEKNGNELDITKMRLMLQKLKHELGVQSAMKRSTLLDTSVGQNFDIDKGATTGADSLLELNSHSKLSTSPPVQSVEHRIKSASSNSSVVSSKMSKLSDQNSSDSKKFVITEPANFPLETKANIYESSKGNIVVKQSLPNADSNEILPERDSHSATEESDYESVAALSMVIKPPDSKESTLTKESNHEDGSTMDHSQKSIHDSNESNLTIKGSQVDIIAKAQSKKLNYADEKVLVESDSDAVYDDDFDDEDSGDEF
ncbi:spermatogenesis-associated protein 7-like isoform X2 [Clavelina lepadiformis]|uniref:spermatogenesis-associated protein 7-like isoform X2 n=1 Tax=Clavelina lepadiformis TaxID=159417 RepID=UPI004042EE8C